MSIELSEILRRLMDGVKRLQEQVDAKSGVTSVRAIKKGKTGVKVLLLSAPKATGKFKGIARLEAYQYALDAALHWTTAQRPVARARITYEQLWEYAGRPGKSSFGLGARTKRDGTKLSDLREVPYLLKEIDEAGTTQKLVSGLLAEFPTIAKEIAVKARGRPKGSGKSGRTKMDRAVAEIISSGDHRKYGWKELLRRYNADLPSGCSADRLRMAVARKTAKVGGKRPNK